MLPFIKYKLSIERNPKSRVAVYGSMQKDGNYGQYVDMMKPNQYTTESGKKTYDLHTPQPLMPSNPDTYIDFPHTATSGRVKYRSECPFTYKPNTDTQPNRIINTK
ncbi:hypothetical protein AMECASPLE_037347 [Ameca splendens]|uniref:Uncharacterized protein n=1 Tax=Ameca splendens TaxID=208324 RepID=A0ABV0YJA7_9TELE